MAVLEAPLPIDVTDIQFKLHSKYQLFDTNLTPSQSNGIDLLATASAFGLIITGHPLTPELQIIQLNDAIDKKDGSNVPRRSVQLLSTPQIISLSCDHTMLAVTYTLDGSAFIDIYSVQSFLSTNVLCVLQKVRVSRDNNVNVKQILWNPVIPNTMAICLDDGTLGIYVLKENSFEYFSIDKSHEARCASWSPKGKQIVVAFPNGKLAQYKPDLKLAKTIPIGAQLFPGPFDACAIQWLSTYQFAVVFLEKRENAGPMLYIINAPKNAQPTYINYDDICYGQPGPRASQVFLIHILQWNLILMGSANSTELGVLGTNEGGETPAWKQYIFLDEARAELPLTADKQDTFPIGVALETGSTHQLTIGENQIPVMPMVHILSTHGFLLSFNLLNFQPTAISICSPPQIIGDRSGSHLFAELSADPKTPVSVQQQQQQRPEPPKPERLFQAPVSNDVPSSNMTFVIPENATSTPTKPTLQTKSLFAVAPEQKTTSSSILAGSTATSFGKTNTFGSPGFGATTFGQTANVTKEPTNSVTVAQVPQQRTTEMTKPFLTVDPNYTPPTQNSAAAAAVSKPSATNSNNISTSSSVENEEILRKMISDEIKSFELTIRSSLEKSKKINVNVCSKEECSELLKNIGVLKDITSQAIKSTEDLNSEIQALRLTLYEAFAMSAEAQSKIDMLNNSNKNTSQEENVTINQSHRRELNKLQNILSQNQARFDIVSRQIDAHWSSHLDTVRDNDRARMYIPTLENVYQTMERQQQILLREKLKINDIKNKVGIHERAETPSKLKYSFNKPEILKKSMIDSVLSMTISDQITAERRPLDRHKLGKLNETLLNRPIRTVKPSRPNRKGLSSEVVIEKRLAYAKEQKKKEITKALPQVQRPFPAKPSVSKSVGIMPHPIVPIAAPSIPSFKTVVSSTPQLPKPSFAPTFSGSSVSAATSNVSPSPIVFGLSKSQSQASFPFNSTTKPSTETPVISKLEPAKVEKPAFSFSNAAKATIEKVEVENPNLTITAVAGNKENLPLEKPKAIFSFTQDSSATPKSASPTPPQKPLTIFGQAANTANIFGGSAVASAAAKETEKTSSAESSSIVRALLTSTAAPKTLTISPVSAKSTVSISTPTTAFVFSSNNAVNASDQSKTSAQSTAAPLNLVKASETSTPITVTASVATTSIASPVTSFSFATAASSSSKATIFGNTSVTITSAVPVTTASTSDTSSIFKGLGMTPKVNVSSSNAASPFASSVFGMATDTPTNAPPLSIASVISLANEAKPSTATAPSSFSFATSAANSTSGSIFGGFGASSTAPSAAAPVSTATTASSDVGSIFNDFSICQPNTSENSNSNSLFSSNAFGGANAFSSPQTSSAPSIFGTSTTVSPAAAQAAGIFGGGNTQITQSPPNTNIFGSGNTNANAGPTTNIFGSTNTGSGVFSSPNQSGGFAAAPAANNSFGNASSPFGNANQTTSGSSLFGSATGFGGNFAQAASNAPVFASPTAFGNQQQNNSGFGGTTATSGFGMQGGSPSIAQSGFGSPTSSSTFGLNPAAQQSVFGQPAFGGSATFGGPKTGFGTFSGANNAFASTSPQKNTLFESLGSSQNAMTFGNLAQAQNSPPPPKPFSGGSSFSSWR